MRAAVREEREEGTKRIFEAIMAKISQFDEKHQSTHPRSSNCQVGWKKQG